MTVVQLSSVLSPRAARQLDSMVHPLKPTWLPFMEEPVSIVERNIEKMLLDVIPSPPQPPFGLVGLPDDLGLWGHRFLARILFNFDMMEDAQIAVLEWVTTGRWRGLTKRNVPPFASVIAPFLDPAALYRLGEAINMTEDTVNAFIDFIQATLEVYRDLAHRSLSASTAGSEARTELAAAA